MCMQVPCPPGPEEDIQSPEVGLTVGCESSDLSSGTPTQVLLQEQNTLLTAGPSLQTLIKFLKHALPPFSSPFPILRVEPGPCSYEARTLLLHLIAG